MFTISWLCELVTEKQRLKTLLHSLDPQLCLTLCNRMDCSLSGSTVHGILQARILEWIAIPFSRGSSWPRDLFIFNWRITTLQYCVGFCHTSWISHRYTYDPSLLNLPPTSHSIPPLWAVTEHQFELPESYSKLPLAICFTYGGVYVSIILSSCWHLSKLKIVFCSWWTQQKYLTHCYFQNTV